LGKWVSEEYRVPGKPVPDENYSEDDEEQPELRDIVQS
jgi:endogenous inhibitor of DNA gyrase (YacG/DUF329 family)